jgi:hypothetical protein
MHTGVLNNPSTEGEPQTYQLKNIEIDVFTLLIKWLYTRNIHTKLFDDGKGTRTQEGQTKFDNEAL